MDEIIKRFLEDSFDTKIINRYEFRKICGFTFVFESEIICIKEQISSASISPVGIIYEENGEYCFAPLHDSVEIDEIIKEYVKVI